MKRQQLKKQNKRINHHLPSVKRASQRLKLQKRKRQKQLDYRNWQHLQMKIHVKDGKEKCKCKWHKI